MGWFTALIAMTEGRFPFLVITSDQPVNRPACTPKDQSGSLFAPAGIIDKSFDCFILMLFIHG